MLFPFQQEAVEFIDARQGRVLIAFDMGLGKSLISLSWLAKHPALKPVIIVAPASAKLNWRNEVLKWFPNLPYVILSGETPYDLTNYTDSLIIINYDVLKPWEKELLRIRPQVLILDEVQLVRNKTAIRTKAAQFLGACCSTKNDGPTRAHYIPHLIALSGTPIINRPIEFLNIIWLINPTIFPSEWSYLKRFCDAKRIITGWRFNPITKKREPRYKVVKRVWNPRTQKAEPRYAWDTSGSSNLEELNTILSSTIMFRRLKAEVAQELPPKIKTVVSLELTNYDEYREAEDEFSSLADKKDGFNNINELKRIAVRGKLKGAIAWIEDVIENNKLLLFCIHHEFVNALMTHFGNKAVKLTGVENIQQRQKAIDDFQTNPEIKLFVGNIQAAGVSINGLTVASNVAFLELDWTPAAHLQAEDRVHRYGQTNTVNVYYLIADGTIEGNILQLLDKKQKIVTQILGDDKPEDIDVFHELVKLYKKKR